MAHWSTTLMTAPESWAEQLLALPRREALRLSHEILGEWIAGTLEPRYALEPLDVDAVRALRHLLVGTFSALQLANFHLTVEQLQGSANEAAVRRWCWIEPWRLAQDEEIFLMDEHLRVPLLEEAGAGCPKRDYVIAIATHAIRDEAHAAVRGGAQAAREWLAAASRWVPRARAARANDLADYCERLSSYAATRQVDADGATARATDLHSCRPASPTHIERRGDVWRVELAKGVEAETLIVEVRTGRLWSEASREDAR